MEPDRLAQLSRRYARYGYSLPGLSLALGGVVIFLFLLVPTLLINNLQVCGENIDSLLAISVALLLAGWILAKEWLRERIYRSLGLAETRNSASGILFIRILTVAIAAMALAFPVDMLAVLPHPVPAPSPVQIYIGMTACFALPWATLRFIRGIQEGILWLVVCFWGLTMAWTFPLRQQLLNGVGPIQLILALSIMLAYFGGMLVGLLQHFEFLRLAREIRNQGTPDE